MKTTTNYLLFTLLSLTLLVASCGGKDQHEHYSDAYASFLDRDYKKALESINEAIHLDSTNNEYYELRAEIYNEIADTTNFQEDLDHILQTDKSDAERDDHLRSLINWDSHKDKANVKKLIDLELALYVSDTAKHIEVVDYAVEKFLEIGDTASAIDLCNQTIKVYPSQAHPYDDLARIELAEKDYRTAIKHFKKSEELAPGNDIVLSNIAYCYMELKNKSQAKKYYKMSAELGNKEACKQYRELTAKTRYYTRSKCCDGSTSSSTGRGACSHHGGVCGIEYVPYKEYTIDCNN